MSYTTITGLITMGLLLLVLLLAVFPTPGVFMAVSALMPFGISMIALKVLRAREKVIERKDDFPWYDSH